MQPSNQTITIYLEMPELLFSKEELKKFLPVNALVTRGFE